MPPPVDEDFRTKERSALKTALFVAAALVAILIYAYTEGEKQTAATTMAPTQTTTTVEETTTTQATTTTEAPTTTTTAGAPGTLSWGQTTTYLDSGAPELEITVDAPQVDTTAKAKYIDPGRQVCVVMVSIRNLTATPQDYNKFDFTAYEGRDFEAPHPSWYMTKLPELEQGTLPPGGVVKGYVPFDLPDDQRIVRVQYDRESDGVLLWWSDQGGEK